METIHAADELRPAWFGAGPVKDGAVLVAHDRIVAVGSLDELRARHPGARVRRWPGVLGPGRVHEGPLPHAPTPRERVHAVLRTGAVAVLARHADDPGLRAAAARTDVEVLAAPRTPVLEVGARADLAVLDPATGECLATVCRGRLVHRRR
jgi:cytosine/adenosine deaminase-related metal-dependent hydrolase